jgi:uncharacterized protein (DUF1684 family)
MYTRPVSVVLILLGLAAGPAHALDFTADTEQWRAKRYESLKKPDGYLTFIGSGVVPAGRSRVGAAAGNDIVLPQGPAKLGMLELDDAGRIALVSESAGEGRIDGEPFDRVELKTQLDDDGPTRIDFGTAWFYVVRTGGLIGWRLRDTQAPLRRDFSGIPHYPVSEAWRIEAHWEPFDPPRTLEFVTVIGTPESGEVPGQAVFSWNGQRVTLWPIAQEDGKLFFVFSDKTTNKTTYGGGRFLTTDAPRDGKLILDFNRAVNPPCALNGHVVCPTAPPENRLAFAVSAGELVPGKKPH